jgi:hypothetical protein
MKSLTVRRAAAFALAAAALLVLGCSDNSTQPKVDKPRYPETTAPEIVIGNLLQSYKDCNFEQFEKLLHDDYVWCNQASSGLPEFYTRSEDSLITRNMFLAAMHTHPEPKVWLDKLELELRPSEWQPVVLFNGAACEDCWETTREYAITLVMDGGAAVYPANDLIKFTVVPVVVDKTKLYRIIRCDDLPMP